MTVDLERAKEALLADARASAETFRTFVPGEMGLFEGVLALASDRAYFVRDRFGTFEVESPITLGAVTNVQRRDGLFGDEVTFSTREGSQRVTKLAKDDAARLLQALGGAPDASPQSLPMSTARGAVAVAPAAAPFAPDNGAGHAVTVAAPAPVAPPSVVVAAPVPIVNPPGRKAPSVVVAPVASVGKAPANPRLASERPEPALDRPPVLGVVAHAFAAGVLASLFHSAAYPYVTSQFTMRVQWWLITALSLPLAEFGLRILREMGAKTPFVSPPFPDGVEPLGARFFRHFLAAAFAIFTASFFDVFITPRFGESPMTRTLVYFAFGVALTWPKNRFPWAASGFVMAVASLLSHAASPSLYETMGEARGFFELPVVILWTVHTLLFNVVKPGPAPRAPTKRGSR